MIHSDFITALGGTAKVARAMEVKSQLVSLWKKRGIPWRYRMRFVDYANRINVEIPKGFFND